MGGQERDQLVRGGAERDERVGCWSFMSFGWVTKTIFKARGKEDLNVEELYLPYVNQVDSVYTHFERVWQDTLDRDNAKRPLLWTLRKMYGWNFLWGGIFKLLWSAFVICGAFYFVRSLLLYVNETEDDHPYVDDWTGWVLATGFFVAAVLWGLSLQRMGYICMNVGVKVRTALMTSIVRKSIRLSHVSAENASEIVKFMANDVGKVYEGLQEFHFLWAAPIEGGAILVLLSVLVQQWALPALGVVGLVMFSQYYFGWQIAINKFKNGQHVSDRVTILQEVLPAMKLVKYYGWEKFFEDKITAIRRMESKLMSTNIVYKTINICNVFTTPPASAFCIFITYEFFRARLTATFAFTSLTLFNILRFPLVVLPKALRAASEASTSLDRIEAFLLQDCQTEEAQHDRNGRGIHMRDAVFQYEADDGHGFKLSVPFFTCEPGEVVAVVGRVGAGKSAVLDALLGKMPMKGGDVRVGGKIAYVPQTAWVQNLTIKDNITFGLDFDDDKYRNVLHACALETDLQILPLGDQSMGGLRGMNLSGGQRQRVNVARAAYFDADTVLLDNALSAVDHHTADHMFSNCIKGLFSDKAVVLVTHQLNFIRKCDKVAIIDHGHVEYFGPYNADAQSILAEYLPVPEEDEAAVKHEKPKVAQKTKAVVAKPEAKPITSLPMSTSSWRYFNAGPGWKLVLACSLGICSQSSRQFSDFNIRYWASDQFNLYNDADGDGIGDHGERASAIYAGFYGFFTFLFWSIQVARTYTFFIWGQHAANRVFKRSLHRVLNTPMAFFLSKPVGELLTTFSSDQDKADESLPDVLHLAVVYGFILLSTAITVSVNIIEFLAFTGMLLLVTAIMLWLYLPAATKVKDMRFKAQGKIVGMTAEVLEGLKLVQAYNHEEHFVNEFSRQTDLVHRAVFTADSLNLWVAFYCDFYGAVMLVAVGMFAVAEKDRGSAKVGLAFSNVIQLLVFYTWTLRLITEAVSLSSSIEQMTWLAFRTPIDGQDDINNEGRHLETELLWKDVKKIKQQEKEEEDEDKGIAPQKKKRGVSKLRSSRSRALMNWPVDGRIVYDNVKMRYRPTANLALAGVDLTVAHGEDVGIVGRTGSGKSTLLMALYRMFSLAEGSIYVAGVDISELPLRKARRGLSIIPQEPVMFSGTLRENLDPFHEHSDFEMYNLLIEVGLREQAEAAGGLDGHVAGSGSDQWSVGQMQLVCLIRAALNKVPIVCLDEATAALDPHTEQQVLKVSRKLFKERTTLTIAHRLDAVIESDTVVVMEKGKVAETGAPDTLLNNNASWFSKLVDMSGPQEAAQLRATAKKHFSQHQQALSRRSRWSMDGVRPSEVRPSLDQPRGIPM